MGILVDFGGKKILILLLLSIITISGLAEAVKINYTDTVCGTDLCNEQSIPDLGTWRMLAAVGILISALFVAFIYMLGKALADNSLITRARNEIMQLVFTILIVAFIVIIVQFVCSSVFPRFLYGTQIVMAQENPSLMKTACVYLSELSTWTQRAYKSTFWTLGAINYIQDIFGTSGPKRTFGELLNIFTLSINNVFALLLTSYIVTVAQIFLLKYIQYFALLYLIPIGVVMRSLFPFRKFGGALIGIAVALLFFLPLLLTLNAFIMDVKFDMNIEISTKCTVNENCCSHVCVNGECQAKLGIGENCISDLQCESGICHPSSKICIACKQLGDTCSAPSKCCKGLTCKEGLCVLAKNLGEQCEEHWDCQSRSCYDGKCILPGAQGSSCRRDTDCYSSKCLPDMRCAGCNLSKTEVFSVSVGGIPIVAEGGAISNIAQIDITSGFSEEGLSALWKKIMSELNKIMEVVVIAVLAGIVLPIINIILLSRAVRDLSAFFGSEQDLSIIWRLA